MGKEKRAVDLVVLSDIHLGTYGSHAKELLSYLKSIEPKKLILNGDIIDIWQFSKRYWPKSHMKVIKKLISFLSQGVEITYIPGNHDEILRKFDGFELGKLKVTNKELLDLDGKIAWIFHGDVFDVTMRHSKWLARLGAVGYDSLILLNRFVNFVSEKVLHKGRISLSKRIKNSVKSAVSFINNFEQTATEIAAEKGYHFVVCGHIHQPCHKQFITKNGAVVYLNSGDWVENLTALEYHNGTWDIYTHQLSEPEDDNHDGDESLASADYSAKELFSQLILEFELTK